MPSPDPIETAGVIGLPDAWGEAAIVWPKAVGELVAMPWLGTTIWPDCGFPGNALNWEELY